MPVTTSRVPFLPFLPLRPAMLTSVLNRLLTFSPPAHAPAPPPQRRASLPHILTRASQRRLSQCLAPQKPYPWFHYRRPAVLTPQRFAEVPSHAGVSIARP